MTTNKNTASKAQFTLTGGLHLTGNKSRSAIATLQVCPLPEQLLIPLNMHAGKDAISIVNIGDRIAKGQNIAEADQKISAYIHSPVDGKIIDIKPMSVANRSGIDATVLVIACDQEQSNDRIKAAVWCNESPEHLLEIVRLAGIVGLGGPRFPRKQKITSSLSQSHTLLLNGAECEPYISCDDKTMQDYSSEVIEGALILARILDCEKIQIAIEDNKQDALSNIIKAVQQCQNKQNTDIEIIEIPTIYPSGGERQLIEIVTGKKVPSGQRPSILGYTVQNVGTALAVHDAVVYDKPLIDRIVTVTGEAVSRPGNYRVTIGTPVKHLLEFAGWDQKATHCLIHGGPMMGFPLPSAELPISKISNCIIAATAEEFPDALSERPCIRCGQCADVCPALLLPQQLLWFSKSGELNKAQDYKLMDCIECGACAYVCPSHIPLVDYYRYTKGEIKTRAAITVKAEQSKLRFEARNKRLENEKIEKQRLREQRKRQAIENKKNKASLDPKQQAVADALARIKAKKKAKTNTDPSMKDNTDV